MQLFHTYYRNKFYYFFHSKFWLFELSVWLHTFSRALVIVFVPIFLLNFDYSISEVMLFYCIFNIFDFPLNFLARRLTYKIGARKVIILGSICSLFYFFILYNLNLGDWPLLITLALFAALYDTLYWVSHIYMFIKCSPNDKNVSQDISFLNIVKQIATMLAPIIGALVIIFFSQKILIIISIIILALSIWPLFKIKHIEDKPENKPKTFKEFFSTREELKYYILQGMQSFHNVAEGVIWPIFIFIIFSSIESVALLTVISSLATIIFTYLVGKVDKSRRNQMMILGSFFIALIWISRLLIHNELFYYASVFLVGLSYILITLPLDSIVFEKGEAKDALAASAYRNAFSMFPRIFFYGSLFILIDIFRVSFVTATIAMVLFLLIVYFCSAWGKIVPSKKYA